MYGIDVVDVYAVVILFGACIDAEMWFGAELGMLICWSENRRTARFDFHANRLAQTKTIHLSLIEFCSSFLNILFWIFIAINILVECWQSYITFQ